MKKIPTLFVRDEDTARRYVKNEVHPECKWVLDGEGIATRKYDGTCVMLDEDGVWWARREVKKGKTAPPNFVECEHDETTGKTVGWMPAEDSSFYKYLQEALTGTDSYEAGTYELCGPKINGDPERYGKHRLIPHAHASGWVGEPRDFDGLRDFLTADDFAFEGIVWHHPDGRMCKLKKRDFPREV